MSKKAEFYAGILEKHNKAGALPDDPRSKFVIDYLNRKGKIKSFFDIGCAEYSLTSAIRSRCCVDNYYGCDIVGDEDGTLSRLGVNFVQCDIDAGIPFSDVRFDIILCSEVIEHVFAPDNVFAFAAQTLKAGGELVITTPNLAAWFNRIALFLGYQPAFSEVSTRYNVGKLYATNKNDVGGHLRMFTFRALKELGSMYGLETVYATTITGGKSALNRLTSLISIAFPMSGNNIFCVMKNASAKNNNSAHAK